MIAQLKALGRDHGFSIDAGEFDGVSLDQYRIKLVQADDLAQFESVAAPAEAISCLLDDVWDCGRSLTVRKYSSPQDFEAVLADPAARYL